MRLTTFQVAAAVSLALGGTGMSLVLLTYAAPIQQRAEGPAGGARHGPPQAQPRTEADELKQAKEALEAARAQLKAAEERVKAARAASDKLSQEVGLRRLLQSVNWSFQGAQPVKKTLRVARAETKGAAGWLALDLPLAREVTVVIDGKEGKVADLRADLRLSFQLADNSLTIAKITATSVPVPKNESVLREVDAARNTISVSVEGTNVTLEGLAVPEETEISINGATAELKDLKGGMRVSMDLLVERGRIVVRAIEARR